MFTYVAFGVEVHEFHFAADVLVLIQRWSPHHSVKTLIDIKMRRYEHRSYIRDALSFAANSN